MLCNRTNSQTLFAELVSVPQKPKANALSLSLVLWQPKVQRVVLVCHQVESVCWMEHDEDIAMAHLNQLVQYEQADAKLCFQAF